MYMSACVVVDAELEDHQTNLTALSSICDEFRMHLNHWMCIKQRIQNNRWLRPLLPSMLEEMRYLNSYFVRLQESAVWYVSFKVDRKSNASIKLFIAELIMLI